jgi:uncharacterized protein YdhG (YjbR/CyaY superfamily)
LPPKTVDAYLASLPANQRASLEKLRATIRAAAPGAEECVSYSLPAFRQGGMLVAYGARPKHCSFFVMSSTLLGRFREDVKGLDTSTGTIRFQPEKPLPASLVTKLVKARVEENLSKGAGKKASARRKAP